MPASLSRKAVTYVAAAVSTSDSSGASLILDRSGAVTGFAVGAVIGLLGDAVVDGKSVVAQPALVSISSDTSQVI